MTACIASTSFDVAKCGIKKKENNLFYRTGKCKQEESCLLFLFRFVTRFERFTAVFSLPLYSVVAEMPSGLATSRSEIYQSSRVVN